MYFDNIFPTFPVPTFSQIHLPPPSPFQLPALFLESTKSNLYCPCHGDGAIHCSTSRDHTLKEH